MSESKRYKKSSKNGIVLFLFPKKFEEEKFFDALKEVGYLKIKKKKLQLFLLEINYYIIDLDGDLYHFLTYVIFNSDIIFAIELLKFYRELEKKRNYKYVKVILMGTCGTSIKPKTDVNDILNQCFQIKEAKKIDRGNIFSCDTKFNDKYIHLKFEIYKKKISPETPNLELPIEIPKKGVICSNHLITTPITGYDDYLYDMETFEFFSISKEFSLDYACVRVVSDGTSQSFYKKIPSFFEEVEKEFTKRKNEGTKDNYKFDVNKYRDFWKWAKPCRALFTKFPSSTISSLIKEFNPQKQEYIDTVIDWNDPDFRNLSYLNPSNILKPIK